VDPLSQHTTSEQLAQLNKIIVGIAHELNNPNAYVRLSAVNLRKMVQLWQPMINRLSKENPDLKIGKFAPQEMQAMMFEQIENILAASVRIISIADKLKMATSHSLLDKTDIAFDQLLRDCLEAHAFLHKGIIDFKLSLPDDEAARKNLVVHGHRLNLEQAFSILITNACDAIRQRWGESHISNVQAPGLLQITAEVINGEVVVTFEDNGCGISEHRLKKIFDPYFTTKREGRGEGLGLAIFKTVMQSHDAKIEVISTENIGTKFIMKFKGALSGQVEN